MNSRCHKYFLRADQVYVPAEVYIADLSRHAIRSLVVLERERDLINVITLKQALIQANLATRTIVKDVFRQLIQGLKHMHLHGLTYRVLSLDMRHGMAADGEVLSNHSKVKIPALEVSHSFSLKLLECERSDVVCQFMFGKDLGRNFYGIMLIFDDANDHALQDVIRLTCVSVRFC